MKKSSPTPQSREIGEELRALRSGYADGREFAHQLGWDPSKVSNIECGYTCPSEVDLAQYLSACGKDKDCISDFNHRYRTAFNTYFAQQPGNFATVAFAERLATTVTCYSKATVPDLLRTDSYTRAIMRRCGASPKYIEAAIGTQQERQRLFRVPKRPKCVCYMTDSVIDAQLSDSSAMIDQLEALKRMTNWEIRIVPDKRAAPFAAGFTVYEYEKLPAVVFIDCDIAKVFAHDDGAVAQCQKVTSNLDDVALSHTESKQLLTERCAQLRGES